MNDNHKPLPRAFWRSQNGATSMEYGILACFLVLAIVAAVGLLGQKTHDRYEQVAEAF